MSFVKEEIASQPDCWRLAAKSADAPGLPRAGERVAVVGCGTSWFMAKAYAAHAWPDTVSCPPARSLVSRTPTVLATATSTHSASFPL